MSFLVVISKTPRCSSNYRNRRRSEVSPGSHATSAPLRVPMSAASVLQPDRPRVLVIMGVSGSGKTTIGLLLAGLLGWALADADSFHSSANVQKMRSHIALTDEDRELWLRAIARWIDDARAARRSAIVTCSALKRSYRDILLSGRPDVRLVYLKGDPEVIRRRVTDRRGHFMPASLLGSQFETLEEPGPDENPVVVAVDRDPQLIAKHILAELGMEAPFS
jgi:gluconokinase